MSFLDNKENKEPDLNCQGKEIQSHEITSQSMEDDPLIAEQKTILSNLEEHVDKIRYEIATIQKENARKDQCIRTCLQEKKADREAIGKDIKTLKELEYNILKHTEEVLVSKKEYQIKASHISNCEKKLLELYQGFERVKNVIEKHKKNEASLLKNYDNVQNQLAELHVKHETLKSQCNEGVITPNVGHEHDAYKKEMSKLQSILKRLEIKSTSLETALKQKSEECLALSALYEDIAGR